MSKKRLKKLEKKVKRLDHFAHRTLNRTDHVLSLRNTTQDRTLNAHRRLDKQEQKLDRLDAHLVTIEVILLIAALGTIFFAVFV